MHASIAGLAPVIIFLVFALVLAVWARRKAAAAGDGGFVKEYFIGNRSLGAFVLAMTTIATYGSVSSFVGGPGQAWNIGWGWVYMAGVQVTCLFLLYGIMGKKMALISRKTGAVTVIDVIRERYQSNAVATIAALVIVLFFATTMIAQFVGGAKLFEYVTGYSYTLGLAIFGIAVILFTSIGGFRGVAVTDALCGIAMIVGICVLAGGILSAGGGYENIMDTIATNHPEMMEPLSGGNMPIGLYFTQWLLVGIFTFALPQSLVRTMGFKDTKSLHSAMIWGTVIIGAMMIGVTALGVLSAGVLTEPVEAYGGSIDNIIPQTIVSTLPPWLAGIAIVGPIAASISTVSSLLIASSSAIIKDLWLHHTEAKGETLGDRKIATASQAITLIIGAIVFVALFWKRANKTGALWGMVLGVAAYCICMALGFKIFGLHQITIGLTVALIGFIVGSLAGKPSDSKKLAIFFG